MNQIPEKVWKAAIKRFPHLKNVKDEKTFCQNLCRLALVPGISLAEYWHIAAVANGGKWDDVDF